MVIFVSALRGVCPVPSGGGSTHRSCPCQTLSPSSSCARLLWVPRVGQRFCPRGVRPVVWCRTICHPLSLGTLLRFVLCCAVGPVNRSCFHVNSAPHSRVGLARGSLDSVRLPPLSFVPYQSAGFCLALARFSPGDIPFLRSCATLRFVGYRTFVAVSSVPVCAVTSVMLRVVSPLPAPFP